MLPLSTEVLRAAYDYLEATPPFCKWNLPQGEDVHFRVVKTNRWSAQHWKWANGHHIDISRGKIGQTITLMVAMAHEMVHLHLKHNKCDDKGMHGLAFQKCCRQVCEYHGFDPLSL
jgi:hypothetical protein